MAKLRVRQGRPLLLLLLLHPRHRIAKFTAVALALGVIAYLRAAAGEGSTRRAWRQPQGPADGAASPPTRSSSGSGSSLALTTPSTSTSNRNSTDARSPWGPLELRATKALLEEGRPELMLDLARRDEAERGDLPAAAWRYAAVCAADREGAPHAGRGDHGIWAQVDQRAVWRAAFPPAYLDELRGLEATLNDRGLSDVGGAKAEAHQEMVGLCRPLLACAQELFRREGPVHSPGTADGFVYATPSIVPHPADPDEDHLILARLVNYGLHPERHQAEIIKKAPAAGGEPNDDGGGGGAGDRYRFRSSALLFWGRNATAGRELRLEEAPGQKFEQPAAAAASPGLLYSGPEDARLFLVQQPPPPPQPQQDGNGNATLAAVEVRVTWVTWEHAARVGGGDGGGGGEEEGAGPRVATGVLDPATGAVRVDAVFPSPEHRPKEKNWVLFQAPGGPLGVVYRWHPWLQVGRLSFNESEGGTGRRGAGALRLDGRERERPTPPSFQHLRGSTNGVYHKSELWFLVHGTTWHPGPGPTYYHRMVVLDPHSLALRRYSLPFKLESADAAVEFSLGMTIDGRGRLTVAYSVWDGSAVLRRIPLWQVEALMVKIEAAEGGDKGEGAGRLRATRRRGRRRRQRK